MSNSFQVGDRVRVIGHHQNLKGRVGTVTDVDCYVHVHLDEYPDGEPGGSYPFLARELETVDPIVEGLTKDFIERAKRIEPRSRFQEIAERIGKLVTEKNAAYNDSASRSAGVINILYPDGVTVDQYRDFLLVIRVIDKLSRIAAGNKHAGGESSWNDIAGYGILGCVLDEKSDR